MKRSNSQRLLIFPVLVFTMMLFGQCDKSCENVQCIEPNTECVDGDCVCIQGVEGDACNIPSYEKFTERNWYVSENCTTTNGGSNSLTYYVSISRGSKIYEIRIPLFFGFGPEVIAQIYYGTQLAISSQTQSSYQVRGGEGEYRSSSFPRIVIDYEYVQNGVGYNCTVTMTPN